jgi:hypothetical protein
LPTPERSDDDAAKAAKLKAVPTKMRPSATRLPWSALRGASLLVHEAVLGVADLVEAMHSTIQRVPAPLGRHRTRRTRGITGLAYRTVRGVTRLVGTSVDGVLRLAGGDAGEPPSYDRALALVSALNGIVGDRLEASANPLALGMTLHRPGGTAVAVTPAGVAAAFPAPPTHVVVLVHGLCMNERQWFRDGHDHGAALERDLGCTPLYVRYNTGRAIAANGRDLADLLDRLWLAWPGVAPPLSIVAHSMGGLVARSACATADRDGPLWRKRLETLIFLGTPHHGAPLERAGRRLESLLALSPYVAPFGRLGAVRSAGIRDLAHGTCHDTQAHPLPLPDRVRCRAIAATLQSRPSRHGLRGDGLVPVASALGRHRDASRCLAFARRDMHISFGTGHLDLLGATVYPRLRKWISEADAASPASTSSTDSVDK